jgi:hypothetical protein
VKYFMNYQHMTKGAARPQDDGTTVEVEVDEKGFPLIPNVGDFVSLDNSSNDMASFKGKVRSRVFRYLGGRDPKTDASCLINIVVEETDDDWGELSKE